MTNKREPLWSDIRIRDRYHALVPCEANMGEMEYWNVLRDVGERVSYELRNDYEVRITELEQKLSRRRNIKAQRHTLAPFAVMRTAFLSSHARCTIALPN